MRVVVVTAPSPVISLAEAKQHLRVDGGDEDALITAYVAAAQGHIDGPDGWLGRAIGVQTLEAYMPAPMFDRIFHLPYPPVIAVTSIEARQDGGWAPALSLSVYDVRGAEVWQAYASAWPLWQAGAEAVRIRYQAGYAMAPPAIRAAILLMTDDLYRNRGESVTGLSVGQVAMSTTVENLLAPFRVYR